MVLIFSIPSSLHIAAIMSSGELGSLIRQQLLGKTKDGEEVVIQDSGRGAGRMVLCNEGLNITGKVVHHHQYVLHHRLLFSSHGNFHAYIIHVHQFHGLGTHNRFHFRKLAFGFELFTSTAVLDGQA